MVAMGIGRYRCTTKVVLEVVRPRCNPPVGAGIKFD